MNFGTITKMPQGICPMNLLTATLPPVDEPLLLEDELRLGRHFRILRSHRGRAATHFDFFKCKHKSQLIDFIETQVDKCPDRLSSNDRMLVICGSLKIVFGLGDRLKCHMHHALMNDNSELQTWLGLESEKDQSRLMVATNCLGTGIDFAAVRIVGIVRSAFKVTDW